jgi:hypothetical protein
MERPGKRDRLLMEKEADPQETFDTIAERVSYVALCLARGAARCGLIEGYFRLVVLAVWLSILRVRLIPGDRRRA